MPDSRSQDPRENRAGARIPAFHRALVGGLCVVGLACLAVVTLASPGATRMHAWPWSLFCAAALLAPALALLARVCDRGQPLALPARDWTVAALAGAGLVAASALASPFRGPSVLWAAPLLGGVAMFFWSFDWLHRDEGRRERLQLSLLLAAAIVAVASVGLWAVQLLPAAGWAEARNPFPLGHSNYTAGLALLMLPVAMAVAFRRHGVWRGLAGGVGVLALLMLFTSGSRGGLLGLAALGAAGLWQAPLVRRRKWQLAAVATGAVLVFAFAHPRTRATLLGGTSAPLVAASEVQRTAMFTAGWRMGVDRPLLGWGPGTTPLAYPKYRGGLTGGAENVLQLHSLPVQLWAELGAAGLLGCGVFLFLAARQAAREPVASSTFLGYGVFALTDWQLDVPVFAAALAAFAALLAPAAEGHPLGDNARSPTSDLPRMLIAAAVVGGLGIVALFGRSDPTPELNTRALALARDPARAEHAAALLRESLALNSDQEIAHFNLGWLLLTREPAAAERHFRAAVRLVPDKGGIYFGLGLARLNQGRPAEAARAFALECLNDPSFLSSPWWREPAIAATREASAAAFADLLRRLPSSVPLPRLFPEQLGRVPAGPERVFRRERTGYPVLMRNLDLAPPFDLYDVREPATPASATAAALPPKGWLPSPLLLNLLETTVPTLR